MDDLEEIIEDLVKRVKILENNLRISGFATGLLIAAVIYLIFF